MIKEILCIYSHFILIYSERGESRTDKQYAKRELLRQQHANIFKKWTKEEAI